MSSYIVLATCAPFLPGFGFRAELQTDGTRYRLVSFDVDAHQVLEAWQTHLDRRTLDPVVRAECLCSDLRPGASASTDAHIAELLCSFWEAYASRPEEFERDPEEIEQVNREWWTRNGDHLTGSEDDGSPIGWE